MEVTYPVKIHYPNCGCKDYLTKSSKKSNFLVCPYTREHYKEPYFQYSNIENLKRNIHRFPLSSVCTYSNGKYNGGVVLISPKKIDSYCVSESDELKEINFMKFSDLIDLPDNSNLINKFIRYFPCLLNFYTLIGITRGYDSVNYTFPKGKLDFNDKSTDYCCLREFKEETGKELLEHDISMIVQNQRRNDCNMSYIPHKVYINNFCLKVIFIDENS
mgnify:CR=1 FL=1